MWIFQPVKLLRKKYMEITWIFRPSKLHRRKYVETTWIFWPSKLHRKEYMETTWIFRPAKLRQKKYLETTWIFRPSKLHQKSTQKWRGNSPKFVLRRIDVISTSNRRGFDMVCPLGTLLCQKKRLLSSPSKITSNNGVDFSRSFVNIKSSRGTNTEPCVTWQSHSHIQFY